MILVKLSHKHVQIPHIENFNGKCTWFACYIPFSSYLVLRPFYSSHEMVIFENPWCNPNDTLDIENLSNSSDSCTNIAWQFMSLSISAYHHTSSLKILLSFFLQLRLHARQQDRVSRVAKLDGRGVPGASDHQLGRDSLGQKTLRVMGGSSDIGDGVANWGLATCLPRL